MGKRKVDPKVKRDALARIQAGASSFGEESKRLGLAKSTLHEALQDVKPGGDEPPPKASDSPLDAARKAAGTAPPDSKTPLTKDELLAAGPSALKMDQDLAVSTVGMTKVLAVTAAGALVVGPSFLFDDRFGKLADLGPPATEATKAAAPQLAPLIRKYLGDSPTLLAFALAVLTDFGMTYFALKEIAAENKKAKEAKKEQQAAA